MNSSRYISVNFEFKSFSFNYESLFIDTFEQFKFTLKYYRGKRSLLTHGQKKLLQETSDHEYQQIHFVQRH